MNGSSGESLSRNNGPWGVLPTVGLSVLVLGVYSLIQFGAVVGWRLGLADGETLLSLVILAAAPAGTALVVLFARMRRGLAPADYLALRPVRAAEYGKWFLLMWGVHFLTALLTTALNRPHPDYSQAMYRTWAFYVAAVLLAPVFEELLFRGFMYRGLAGSRAGAAGAVVLTSLAWSLIHVQYDIYWIAMIFVLGLLLGWARHRTGSTLVAIVLHAANNLLAVAGMRLAG